MVRYLVAADGRVQGVGFRFFCQMNATSLGLTGYAYNMDNGMVELQVQGESEAFNKFISIIKKGNMFIRVDDISLKKLPVNLDEKKFVIK